MFCPLQLFRLLHLTSLQICQNFLRYQNIDNLLHKYNYTDTAIEKPQSELAPP